MVMKYGVYILMAFFLMNCGNTKTYTEQEQQEYQNLKDMITSQKLEIQSDYARPMANSGLMQVANTNILGSGNSANNINISGNSNILTIKGDSISGYFPYFGEVQFGGGYPGSNHQGIEFKDVPEDYQMIVNDEKHTVNINFKIDDQYRNNEHYNVFITLFPNNRSIVQVNSTNRSSIEYSGYAKKILETKKN
jgi:hypothetical protein